MDSRFHKLHQLTSNSHQLDPFDPPVMRFSETLTSTLATATALGSSASQSAPNGSLTVQPDASTISRTPSPTISMTNTRPDSSMLSQSGAAPSATPANQTVSADDKNHRALGDRILDLQDALQLLHDNFLAINAGGVDDKRHIRPNVTSLIATVKTNATALINGDFAQDHGGIWLSDTGLAAAEGIMSGMNATTDYIDSRNDIQSRRNRRSIRLRLADALEQANALYNDFHHLPVSGANGNMVVPGSLFVGGLFVAFAAL